MHCEKPISSSKKTTQSITLNYVSEILTEVSYRCCFRQVEKSIISENTKNEKSMKNY